MCKVTAEKVFDTSAGLLYLFMVNTPICLTSTSVNWSFLASLSWHRFCSCIRSKHVRVEKRGVNVCTVEDKLGNSVDQKL